MNKANQGKETKRKKKKRKEQKTHLKKQSITSHETANNTQSKLFS